MTKFKVEISKVTNCICNICHGGGRVAKIDYYTKDYCSNKRPGKICKTLQKHPRSIWVCGKATPMLTMTECHRTNLCIDCDDPHCSGAGNAEADCPLWECECPGVRCEECDILREYVEAYRKEGDTIDIGSR